MNYLNYFVFEDVLSGILELIAFMAFVMLYFATRGAPLKSWKKYFNYSMGLMALTYFLPFSLGWLSFFLLEDLSEKYYGVIHMAGYYVPMLLALACFISAYRIGFKNA